MSQFADYTILDKNKGKIYKESTKKYMDKQYCKQKPIDLTFYK